MMAERPPLISTQILLALPNEGACVTVPQVAEQVGRSRKDCARALDVLHRRGLVRRERPGCYLVTAVGVEARQAGVSVTSGPRAPHTGRRKSQRKPSARDQAWKTIRRLEKFTLDDVIEVGEIGGRDPHSNLGVYIRALQKAGYLRELRNRAPGSAPTSNGHKRYLLIRDSGPQAPRLSRKRGDLFDPNTEETHPIAGGTAL